MDKKNLYPFSLLQDSLESYFIRITARSRIIYWIIITTVVLVIVALPFIYVDISIQARGFFQTDIEKQIISTPFYGRVIHSSILTGKKINRGDTLLVIDSEALRAQKEALMKRIMDNNISMRDLEKLSCVVPARDITEIKGLQSPRYTSEFADYSKRHFIQLQRLRKSETEHERNTLLHRQKLIPDADFENSLYSCNVENENLNQIIVSHTALWQVDLEQRRTDSARLDADLRQLNEELKNRIILAPVDGEIIKSAEIQEGTYIAPNQNIAEISPDGELLATCFVKPSDIGMIYEHQPVKIQVDAFNYNEWGMLSGRIIDISDDLIIENNSAAFFRVRCRLDERTLQLKNGYKADMKKGMSLNARMLVTRRSLFNLLFDKADKWFNPYMNNRTIADAD